MTNEYIRRQDAIIEMMDNDVDHAQGTDGREVVQILSDIPAADVVPVAHARWVNYSPVTIKCSRCGHVIHDWRYSECKYCPNCGAKMDGEKE